MSSKIRTTLATWALAASLAGSARADYGYSVRVEGNGRELGETPVVIELDPASPPRIGNYLLSEIEGGTSLAANVFQDGTRRRLAIILDRVPGSGHRTFTMRWAGVGDPGHGVEVRPADRGNLEVSVEGRPFTTYVPADGPKPYYFPLIGPSGASMTRAFPMKKVDGEKYDHPHHRSLWFTHGSVNKVDFWSEAPNHGSIRETSRPTAVGGSAAGAIRTTDDWVGPDGKKVCEDERVLLAYNTRAGRVLDFDVTLKATAGPVTFGDTKEGMFGLRVASSMDVTAKQGGRIVNAGGITDRAAWGLASPWVEYSGPAESRTVGVAILNHPESFRYPTTWHVRDYGLFAANPFGWHDFGRKESGEFVLADGQSIRFRYRVILHDGGADPSSLNASFRAYEAPPKVTVTE